MGLVMDQRDICCLDHLDELHDVKTPLTVLVLGIRQWKVVRSLNESPGTLRGLGELCRLKHAFKGRVSQRSPCNPAISSTASCASRNSWRRIRQASTMSS